MSSLKDLASLIMIPSLYKDGRLDTVKPLGNSIIHPDATGNNDGTDGTTPAEGNFTFSRGSNLAATRVDVNGLIEKGRENLLLYSQDFSNAAWSKSNLSLTANQTDPNGGTNAFLFTSTSASNNLFVQSLSNQNKVCSIYAKAGNRSIFAIVNNTYGNGATFDLSAETAISSGQGSLAVIESVGNDWYRCSVYFSLGTQFLVVLSDVNGSGYSNGDTISFFGSQMELGTIATPYIETGASTAQAGILEDMPRLDYSGGASCPALLLEPQRTNLITQSEYFADSSYIDNGVSFTLGFLSPDGNLNASKLLEDNTNSIHRFYQTSLVTASPNATISVYVKHNGRRFVLLRIADSGVGRWYDVENGILGTTFQGTPNDSTIESVGNDWYRITISHSVASQARFEFWVSDTESTSAYQGDATKGVYLYGAQLEAGSYPTSYIPTYGSSVTRSLDVSSLGGLQTSSILNGTKGTLLFEGIKNRDWYFTNFVITANSNVNQSLLIDNSGSAIRLRAWNASSSQDAIVTTSAVSNGTFKYLIRWDNGNLKVFINGVSAGTASINAYSYTTLNLKEGTWSNNLPKQLLLFPTALTDSECIALTTL